MASTVVLADSAVYMTVTPTARHRTKTKRNKSSKKEDFLGEDLDIFFVDN